MLPVLVPVPCKGARNTWDDNPVPVYRIRICLFEWSLAVFFKTQMIGALAKVPIWDYHHAMKVIAKRSLIAFWEKYPDSEQPLKAWHDEAKKAFWKTLQDIKRQYASASFLPNNHVVFNIKGNQYRLVVAVAYKIGAVYVKFVGTDAEYDRTDVTTMEMR